MRRNHPRFSAQIPGRRYDRNAAGTVMYSVTTAGPVATSAAVAVRLLCLAHVLGRNSAGHDSVVTAAVVLRFSATMLLLLLMGQRNHVGWSRQRLVVSGGAGWNSRMVVMSVVVDPRSLGWYVWRWNARQVRQVGRWRWWVAHVLWWGGMAVHHRGWRLVFFNLSRNTPKNSPSAIGSVCNSRSGCSVNVGELFRLS